MIFVKKLNPLRNDVVFGADIIAGFPTETDEMFQDSLDIIKNVNLTHLHIFPYSIRKNTPAAKCLKYPKDIIKKRARSLREEGKNKCINIFKNKLVI